MKTTSFILVSVIAVLTLTACDPTQVSEPQETSAIVPTTTNTPEPTATPSPTPLPDLPEPVSFGISAGGLGNSIHDMAFTQDGSQLVISGDSGLYVVDTESVLSGNFDADQKESEPLKYVTTSPDETRFAFDWGGKIYISAAGKATAFPVIILKEGDRVPASVVDSMQWSPDGDLLYSHYGFTFTDQYVGVWDAQTGEQVHLTENTIDVGDGILWTLGGDGSLSPDGTKYAMYADNTLASLETGTLQPAMVILDAQTWEVLSTFDWEEPDSSFAGPEWSPDGSMLVAYNHVIDAKSGERHHPVCSDSEKGMAVAWSPDGAWIAQSQDGGSIFLCRASTGEHIQTLEGGHQETVWGLRWSPDSKVLLSTSMHPSEPWFYVWNFGGDDPDLTASRATPQTTAAIEVRHDPNPAALQIPETSDFGFAFICLYATSVKAVGVGVHIEEFGMYFWEDEDWVKSEQTFTPQDFADWYQAPDSYIAAGEEYTDHYNWNAIDENVNVKGKWYYAGTDDFGNPVRGEAIIECQPMAN
jgi:hypothetical protein